MPVRKLKDPGRAVADMIDGLRTSKAKYIDGRLNPRVDPKAATLDAAELYEENTRKSLDEHLWKKRMETADFSVTEDQAKKGADKLVAGVVDREPKVLARTAKYYSFLGPHVDAMNAIKVKSDEDAAQKMLDNLAGMRAIGKKMKGA